MTRRASIIAVLILLCLAHFDVVGMKKNPTHEFKLKYDQPAKIWEEALPLGNSRLGVMVYGIPQREELQLNEETIWAGSPYRNENEKALHALPEARKLIFEGKTKEADQLVNETFFTRTHGMPYQTAGSVILDFPGHENYQDYYRELDINKAVALRVIA